jgi:polyisoprenoid-binding protein YceI
MSTQVPENAAAAGVDGLLSTQQTWRLDPWHTAVQFATRNRGAGRVRGRFLHASGTVTTGADVSEAQISVEIDTASLTTGVSARDHHLRGAGFFDVERFPTATFVSREVVRDGAEEAILAGDLTFKGQTQQVRLAVRWEGSADDPFVEGATHLAFSATGTLRLSELGLGQPLGQFKVPGLGDTVDLLLDVVLISYDPAPLAKHIPID